MHWPIDAEILRPLIPSQLAIDISMVPRGSEKFRSRCGDSRLVPATHSRHQAPFTTQRAHLRALKRRARRLVLSLDAANGLAVWGARTFYHLPYFKRT